MPPAPLPPPNNVQTLISDALIDAGVVGFDQDIEPVILNKALRIANRLLAQWNHKRFLVYHLVDYAVVSTGALSYAVGKGQPFNIDPRPDRIESAFLRLLNNNVNGQFVDLPIEIIPSMEDYNRIALKNLGTLSWRIFYDSGWPLGKLLPWPVPQASIYELHVTFKETLTRFASIGDLIKLPDEYEAALEWVLARRYIAAFQMPANPEVNSLARDGINTIRLANVQIPVLQMPDALRNRNRAYSYQSDT